MTNPSIAIAAAPGTTTTSPVSAAVAAPLAAPGAAAATTAIPVLGAGSFTPAAAATTLPSVMPVWSETIRRSFGLAVQPQMQHTPYGAVDVWAKHAADLGVTYIRGKFN